MYSPQVGRVHASEGLGVPGGKTSLWGGLCPRSVTLALPGLHHWILLPSSHAALGQVREGGAVVLALGNVHLPARWLQYLSFSHSDSTLTQYGALDQPLTLTPTSGLYPSQGFLVTKLRALGVPKAKHEWVRAAAAIITVLFQGHTSLVMCITSITSSVLLI